MNRQQTKLPSRPILQKPIVFCGIWLRTKHHVIRYLVLPYEMEGVDENEVLPKIQQQFVLPALYHKINFDFMVLRGKCHYRKNYRIIKGKQSSKFHPIMAYLPIWEEGAIEAYREKALNSNHKKQVRTD